MTTVRINLRNNAVTQYSGYPFESFCVFNGRPIAAGENGIFTLDNSGDSDVLPSGSVNIDAWFELPESQYGINYVKQGRRLYIGGEFSGNMYVKIDTFGKSNTYTATPRSIDLSQHVFKVPLKHNQKGEYWKMTVGNVNGADFSLEFIDGLFVIVNRQHGFGS